mmetsp:Transcript_18582/g.27249  ORF Transcript_18582/g.27249 Transcript_18582/m.27249 type:complete len:486 (+) Transcript_18582:77-1534(+)|eukprot:CAMPEP_0195528052 /NCGR_PEP_ID=MMETSP0794_2-20130614/30027_1 /TAXON_ID=515487 /ORGANISM="Stephanopyxis turris, Strain CCMP 815" /LENGTH=485 /DNA_ID=CAMNT_0040659101 /DNA_START=64 /DNA_END=1521 /DNA_ORIENTATION=-
MAIECRSMSLLNAALVFVFLCVPSTTGLTIRSMQSGILSTSSMLSSSTTGKKNSGRSTVLMMAKVPVVDEWKILRSGALFGVVTNHPYIEDGDFITTSPLSNPKASFDGETVKTKTGSLYKLGVAKGGPKKKALSNNVASSPKREPTSSSEGRKGGGFFSFGGGKKENKVKVEKVVSAAAPNVISAQNYDLNGLSIGNGKYLLSGKPKRSTSGKSNIYKAYKADKDGNPTGDKIIAKLSNNLDALKRENLNYNKVTGGLLSGSFVKKIDFLPEANGKGFENQAALVIESGAKDLKELLLERKNRGLQGRAMRDAAAAAGQCIQAMHSSSMVWTDLKTENFVIVTDANGDDGLPGVKGIDLESAIPFKGNPTDYSPEACPPEFADSFLKGYGTDFVLGPNYDMWSLGMMLYELSVGKAYFDRKSPSVITTTLRRDDFVADVSKIKDSKLRDLVGLCLMKDPKKRPSITQFLLHPYFTTSGVGPFGF